MLIQGIYIIVEGMFVAMIVESAFTAISMVMPVYNMMSAFAVGIGVGMSALVSKNLGEKFPDAANNAGDHGIMLMVIVCALFAVCGMLFSGTFFMPKTRRMKSPGREKTTYSLLPCFLLGCLSSLLLTEC
jgi:Na+-driven multidrug efflux pump